MKDNEIIELINELLSYAEIYEGMLNPSYLKTNVVHFSRYEEKENKHYSFRIDFKHLEAYKKLLNGIYTKGNIKKHYTIKSIDDALHNFLFENKMANKNVSEKEYQRFIQSLIIKKQKKITYFHMVYGVDVTNTEPVAAGCFTFYNYKKHKSFIMNKVGITEEDTFLKCCRDFSEHDVWVSTDVEANDTDFARETAYRRFETLQGICQFVLDVEGLNGHIVCVLEDIPQSRHMCYSFCEGAIGSKFDNYFCRVRNIDLINLLTDKHNLFVALTERLFTVEKNDIHNRIINALITYSRIAYQHSDTQKFLLYITTIESLIEYDSKNLTDMITRYISAILAEEENYKAMKEDFKVTYNQRSKISHGSRVDILIGDLEYARAYAINLLYSFIINDDIKAMSKNKELKAYLENKSKVMEEGVL